MSDAVALLGSRPPPNSGYSTLAPVIQSATLPGVSAIKAPVFSSNVGAGAAGDPIRLLAASGDIPVRSAL